MRKTRPRRGYSRPLCRRRVLADRSAVPDKLTFRVGSDLGTETRVELMDDQRLLLRRYRGQVPVGEEVVETSASRWRGFRRVLDKLDVWSWQNRYPSEPPGTGGWAASHGRRRVALVIHWGEHRVESGGYMAYPEVRTRPDEEELASRRMSSLPEDCAVGDYSEDFKDLCRAVSRLVGGHEFGGYKNRPRSA